MLKDTKYNNKKNIIIENKKKVIYIKKLQSKEIALNQAVFILFGHHKHEKYEEYGEEIFLNSASGRQWEGKNNARKAIVKIYDLARKKSDF